MCGRGRCGYLPRPQEGSCGRGRVAFHDHSFITVIRSYLSRPQICGREKHTFLRRGIPRPPISGREKPNIVVVKDLISSSDTSSNLKKLLKEFSDILF